MLFKFNVYTSFYFNKAFHFDGNYLYFVLLDLILMISIFIINNMKFLIPLMMDFFMLLMMTSTHHYL